jgi:hypothetical protein
LLDKSDTTAARLVQVLPLASACPHLRKV